MKKKASLVGIGLSLAQGAYGMHQHHKLKELNQKHGQEQIKLMSKALWGMTNKSRQMAFNELTAEAKADLVDLAVNSNASMHTSSAALGAVSASTGYMWDRAHKKKMALIDPLDAISLGALGFDFYMQNRDRDKAKYLVSEDLRNAR